MDQDVKVALVKASSRRQAVRQALELIADDLRRQVRSDVLIKPNLVSHRSQLASTHAETLEAALDAVTAAGATRVTIAEGASDASAGFQRFGYPRIVGDRPVRFLDINREESCWDPLELTAVDGMTHVARVSRTITTSPCRVSLALAKTHVTSMVTLSLKNMLSSIHPDDRVMMHGHAGGGNGYEGWKRLVVEFLKGDNLAVNALTRAMGRVKNARNAWRRWNRRDRYEQLSPAEMGFLRSVEAMNHNLAALACKTRPHIAIVDGFMAMHREGPRHGTPIKLGTVIAGTDPVAVDAVAASVMGFDPGQIGFLVYAQAAGLGEFNLDRIRVVGDTIEAVRRRCVPHSNHEIQRHWYRLGELTRRGPHFGVGARRQGRISVR